MRNLKTYLDIPRNVTFTINMKDRVLSLAESHHRISRVGRPRKEDLTSEHVSWARNASVESNLDVIGVDKKTVTGMPSRSHDFWYMHPWVSSDVLVQLAFHADAEERGLIENFTERGFRYWTFPPDYPNRIINVILKAEQKGG